MAILRTLLFYVESNLDFEFVNVLSHRLSINMGKVHTFLQTFLNAETLAYQTFPYYR